MVGVDRDRKEKVVGDMIQRAVPLMMSRMASRVRCGNVALSAMPQQRMFDTGIVSIV